MRSYSRSMSPYTNVTNVKKKDDHVTQRDTRRQSHRENVMVEAETGRDESTSQPTA